jgi:hypothetical protein
VPDPNLLYRPLTVEPRGRPATPLGEEDRYVFQAIATSGGLSREAIAPAVDAAQRKGLSDAEVAGALDRLERAGYIQVQGEDIGLPKVIENLLPKTASGRVSSLREAAWDQVFEALFAGAGDPRWYG